MTTIVDKTDKEIDQWIKNYEAKKQTDKPFYYELLEERARRTQAKHVLNMERSLTRLRKLPQPECVSRMAT